MELTHFDSSVGSRAFGIRVCFNHAGIDWKDNRVSYQDFVAAKKEGKFPTGLPILKLVNGREITQSCAILRYAGKLCGLYPEDPLKAMVCDSILDTLTDLMAKAPQASSPEEKKKLREEYAAGRMKSYMSQLTSMVEAEGGKFCLGNELTIADLHLIFVTGCIATGEFDYVPAEYLDGFPKLKELNTTIMQHAIVTKWMTKLEESKK